jgi:hypothetical protein
MPHTSHLAELERKHRALDQQIREAMRHPASDPVKVTHLKREKLLLKDEIMKFKGAVASRTVH